MGRPRSFTRGELLAVLASLPSDRTTPATIAASARVSRPGATQSVVAGVISEAERAGEVEVSRVRRTGTTLVCLTPLGASRAGVHLSADSTLWVADGEDELKPWVKRRLPGLRGDDDDVLAKLTERDTREPLDRVIAIEDDELRGRATTLHVILGLTTWLPLPTTPHDPDDCPMHPGRRPEGREYCIWCETDCRTYPKPDKPHAVRLPS